MLPKIKCPHACVQSASEKCRLLETLAVHVYIDLQNVYITYGFATIFYKAQMYIDTLCYLYTNNEVSIYLYFMIYSLI